MAVHIRRGDYLNSINQKSLGEANVIGNMQYYKEAMELMIENWNHLHFVSSQMILTGVRRILRLFTIV